MVPSATRSRSSGLNCKRQSCRRTLPDLDLRTADGPTRVFTLLRDARPMLLNLGEPGGFDISPWAN
jgi:hypothetical protein